MASSRNFILAAVVLCVCAFTQLSRADDTEEGDDIVTEVLFKPDSCDRLTKNYDLLSMHYTGTLTETGVKFDSR
jgi:hypothetical protein